MRIREEAFPFAVPPLLLAAGFVAAGLYWAALLPAALGLFVCAFFRDPERIPPEDPLALVSPADGVVCQIAEENGRKKISVFMSVFNVHVNRAPSAGRLTALHYNPGKFMAAWNDKASLDNEQMRWTLDTPHGELEMVQIAGLVARRIVPFIAPGTALARAERFGLIRFGSRVDLYAPAGVQVVAQKGQRVQAGVSVLARWEKP